jgi:hypothetical protein
MAPGRDRGPGLGARASAGSAAAKRTETRIVQQAADRNAHHLRFLDVVDPRREMMPFERSWLAEQARRDHFVAVAQHAREQYEAAAAEDAEAWAEVVQDADGEIRRSSAWLVAYELAVAGAREVRVP